MTQPANHGPGARPRRLVLVGAGHAHVEVLRTLARRPLPGVEVILATREAQTPYSGAVPLLVAGHVPPAEAFIDAAGLARLAGARLVLGEARSLDLAGRRLLMADGAALAFDVLSLDIGCVPDLSGLERGAGSVTPVKPIGGLLPRVEALAGRAVAEGGRLAVAVVGTGVAGTEIAFALHHRLRSALRRAGLPSAALQVTLVGRAARLVPSCNARTRAALGRRLAEEAIPLLPGFDAFAFDSARLLARDGRSVGADAVVWATGSAAAPWLADAGIATDPRGFVRVDECLRSLSHPAVFAAGDVIALPDPRPKAGVFAVREGPILAANLVAALGTGALRPYRPQRRWLSLISTGDRHAVADRGALSLEGRWVWHWKRRIDARFVRRFDVARYSPSTPPPDDAD